MTDKKCYLNKMKPYSNYSIQCHIMNIQNNHNNEHLQELAQYYLKKLALYNHIHQLSKQQ